MKRIFLSRLLFLSLCFCMPVFTFAQEDNGFVELPDSIREKEHSPTKATLMSACLPGLGQIYNKKYWKVPVLYVGFGIMGYFIYTNADQYLTFKCAYIESSYGNMNGSYSSLVNRYTKDELLSAREYYRRNLEVSILLTTLWYVLNLLDATVDAHLYTFNISKNLSFNVEPQVQPGGYAHKPSAGIKLKINF
ncbi:MAG: DUF5683 domain-containing protein [Bacteroidetes bacterium]|nr:DUF5683 domain-containing protein [Bacteroidota bacterium]